jgi:rhodanese-related sulfurtransferase
MAPLALAGCGGDEGTGERTAPGATAPGAEVALVAPDEFAERTADPDAVLVNVHVPYEGEIAGTDLFVPFDEIASSNELPSDHDRPLLVYCRTGDMSATATADLIDAGYTDVTDLEGGMVAWQAADRSVEIVPDRSGTRG